MRGLRFGGVIAALVAALVCVPGALGAPPSNDLFASAAVLAGEFGTSDWTNLDATKESGEPNHAGNAGGRSIWFSWVAPRDGSLLIDTCDSAIDTLLAVYTGEVVHQLDLVIASDDDCGTRSGVELEVLAGEELRIAVDGKDGVQGPINLWWGMRPENDNFADATVLTGWEGVALGSNVLASHEGEGSHYRHSEGSGSVWYRWTAPATGAVEFETCDSDFDSVLAVYRGTTFHDRTAAVSADDGCGLGTRVELDVVGGQTYFVAVDGYGAFDYGTFSLAWQQAGLAPRMLRPPSITGVLAEGEVLTGELGEWTGTRPVTLVFWWEQCDAAQCWKIEGTHNARTLKAVAGWTVRFAVSASNRAGAVAAYSERVTIAARPLVPPVNVSPPVISGRPRIGKRLSVDSGSWSGTPPFAFVYQWQRCDDRPLRCAFIEDGTGPHLTSYTLPKRAVGWLIRVRVGAIGRGGMSEAYSATVGPVLGERAPQQRVSCRVPRLTGKTLRVARTSLARAHCRLGKVRRVHSVRKAGRIVGQTPRPGTRLRAGGRVSIRISKGRRR